VSSRREVFFHSRISFKQVKQSLKHACLVLFSSFCATGAALNGGVHSHQVLAKSSSQRVRGIESTQPRGLRHDKKSERVGNIAFTQPQSATAASKATGEMQASADSNKMPSIFQLIVGSKQTYEMKPQQDLIDF
jgi:hypothetical protein